MTLLKAWIGSYSQNCGPPFINTLHLRLEIQVHCFSAGPKGNKESQVFGRGALLLASSLPCPNLSPTLRSVGREILRGDVCEKGEGHSAPSISNDLVSVHDQIPWDTSTSGGFLRLA